MKTNKTLSFIIPALITFFAGNTFAQEFQWARKAGYYAFDYGYGVCADDAGNIYVAGKYEMDAIFDQVTVPCDGNHDIFTAKYSPAGALQWVRVAGGEWGDYAQAVTCDGAGNVYVVGEIEMTVQFHGSSTSLSTWGSNDIFVAKYNTNGDLLWAHRAGGRESDKPHAVAVAGNFVYVAGKIKDTAYFNNGAVKLICAGDDDIFLAKYGTDGTFHWARRAGGPGEDEAHGVTVDAEGNIYITGFFDSEADFSGKKIEAHGAKDIFVAKYSPNGDLIWVKREGGLRNDAGAAIKAAADGRIYVTGGFREKSMFGNIEMWAKKGDLDIFTACYTKNGDVIWVKRAGGDINDKGMGIATDANSNVYVTGYYGFSADFSGQTITAADSADIFVVKYNKDGALVWLMKVDGSKDHAYVMGTEEAGRSIWVDKFNNVIVTGSFRSDAQFGNHYLQGWEHSDIFVAKIKQPESSEPTSISSHKLGFAGFFDIYPNPADGQINIYYSGEDARELHVEIQNLQGQLVLVHNYAVSGPHNNSIALEGIAAGFYLVKINSDNYQYIKKIVVK
jgi:hypothetical protein